MSSPRGDAGFTLIEVLVALTILALAAGFAFSALSSGMLAIERAHAAQDAVLTGQSLLARLGHDIEIKPSHLTGTAEGRDWQVDIGASLADPPPAAGLAAFPVSVVIHWQDDRGRQTLRLDSNRLGPAPVTP